LRVYIVFLLVILGLALSACSSYNKALFLLKPAGSFYKDYDFCLPKSNLKVLDGDTLRIRSIKGLPGAKAQRIWRGQKVRLIGIDAPEIAQEPFGDASKRHLNNLIGEQEAQVCCKKGIDSIDQYGRILAYCWAGETFLNAKMIRDGQALSYFIGDKNSQYKNLFMALEEESEQKELGIHDSKQLLIQAPSSYRAQNKKHLKTKAKVQAKVKN
jgi:micrococcal nuclease